MHTPIILLPRSSGARQLSNLSFFKPSSILALRNGLFRSPETLAALRYESADKFLRWREISRNTSVIQSSQLIRLSARRPPGLAGSSWNKSEWEFQWEATLSQDIARQLRTSKAPSNLEAKTDNSPGSMDSSSFSPRFDPLHLPSLLCLSLSVITAMEKRLLVAITSIPWGSSVKVALTSGFCLGVGVVMLTRH
jgi:hypothetical protein